MRIVGPGLVIAATGVGAGDLVAAAVSGSRYGFAVVWVALLGAALKFTLNEGLARWQLATGKTLVEGWVEHLGRWVQYVFLFYLIVWSFVVAGALISACGLAAHALCPVLSVEVWGVLHSIVAALLVQAPGKTLIDIVTEAALPAGSGRYILGVIGGVGGSVTLLSYGYWIRERGWEGPERMRTVRLDLAAAVLFGGPPIEGSSGVITMAGMLHSVVGPIGHWTFLVGFWGAPADALAAVRQTRRSDRSLLGDERAVHALPRRDTAVLEFPSRTRRCPFEERLGCQARTVALSRPVRLHRPAQAE